jgi:hypothetical protein
VDAVVATYVFNHVPREQLGAVLTRIAGWLRPGGRLLASFGAGGVPSGVYEWLGVPMFFSSHDAGTNRRLLTAAGFSCDLDEVVSIANRRARCAYTGSSRTTESVRRAPWTHVVRRDRVVPALPDPLLAGGRRRGARHSPARLVPGARLLAWAMLPMALYLIGAVALVWRIGTAITRFVTGFAFSPKTWSGVVLLVVAVVLFAVTGRCGAGASARGRRLAPRPR